ncbi:MAG: hypothetical protein M0D55_17825 [Elusimicrobiota bacterium]|nr:MAG: hypothetical protein M0D55_17825 [Elusimicrobiota bacterium]
MKPDPRALVDRLRSIHPKLKRLAVIGNANDTEAWAAEVRRAGLEVVVAKPSGADAVPEALRGLAGKADAIWLCPDPSLVTPQAFQAIKQFSWDHSAPFYAPTAGLAAAGAAAAVSVVPAESGRRAAELVRLALAGEDLPDLVYAAITDLTVNPESAAKAGLVLTPEALNKADKVIR